MLVCFCLLWGVTKATGPDPFCSGGLTGGKGETMGQGLNVVIATRVFGCGCLASGFCVSVESAVLGCFGPCPGLADLSLTWEAQEPIHDVFMVFCMV